MPFDLPPIQTETFRNPLRVAAILALATVGFLLSVLLMNQAPAHAADVCIGTGCDSVVFVGNDARFTMYSDADPGSGVARIYYGNPGDEPLMGDWDCDGVSTPAMYRRSQGLMYLRNSNSPGVADSTFFFGSPGDIPIAGDFNGNGCDTVSIYRPSEQRFYITNKLGGGVAQYSFMYGNPGDTPFVGDFDGNGVDTVGLHRVSTGRVYLTNDWMGRTTAKDFTFGDPGDIVFAGDWDGDRDATVGAYRKSNGMLYLRNSNNVGHADVTFYVGSFSDAAPASGLPAFSGSAGNYSVDVHVYPGDNLGSLARNKPSGTVFMIHGSHSRQSVTPKDGQVFLGATGSVLDGGNSVQYAFQGSASNVVVRNLEIANYSAAPHFGAIYVTGSRWLIEYNEIHHTRGEAIAIRDDSWVNSDQTPQSNVIRDNYLHHNHHLGIAVRGTVGTVVEGNEIAYNNWLGEYDGLFEAGGTKFWATESLIVRNNYSHHNDGPGLWSDHDNNNVLYEGNRVENNTGPGIFHEISYSAVIRNNTIRRNGFSHSPWLWGGGIVIAASQDVAVYGNVLEGNANGISLIQQSRGSGSRGAWIVRNVQVTNNRITDGRSGAVQDIGDNSIFYANNNFSGNTYRGNASWAWNNNNQMGWSSWQATGNDSNGSYIR